MQFVQETLARVDEADARTHVRTHLSHRQAQSAVRRAQQCLGVPLPRLCVRLVAHAQPLPRREHKAAQRGQLRVREHQRVDPHAHGLHRQSGRGFGFARPLRFLRPAARREEGGRAAVRVARVGGPGAVGLGGRAAHDVVHVREQPPPARTRALHTRHCGWHLLGGVIGSAAHGSFGFVEPFELHERTRRRQARAGTHLLQHAVDVLVADQVCHPADVVRPLRSVRQRHRQERLYRLHEQREQIDHTCCVPPGRPRVV
mmetsp:Transcript_16697/g.42633  ORF Transcript_16697/g.42633 Transcript_16697/m.42633 type:complete len:258 (+) Transcript_16697:874-1647(+)